MKVGNLIPVLCFLVSLDNCFCGRTAFTRRTTLDELQEIDSYVANALPLFDHGFFVNTAQGPILVKAGDDGRTANKPKLNPGYYSTLPRLIPEGYEGLSISHFNLGTRFPAQAPSIHAQESRQFIQHAQPRDSQSQQSQDAFQVNEFLPQNVPTSYQNTMIAHEPSRSRNLVRNPTVEQVLSYEDTLPENLKNPFYKNSEIQLALAQESLPVEGEQVLGGEWETTKIQKKRIHDLLRDAGFLR